MSSSGSNRAEPGAAVYNRESKGCRTTIVRTLPVVSPPAAVVGRNRGSHRRADRDFLVPRPGLFRIHRRRDDCVHLPAGEGGRHQHDADARQRRAHLHQQVHLSVRPGRRGARRHGGVLVSAGHHEIVHQARDRASRRPHSHRRRPGIRERTRAAGEATSPRSFATTPPGTTGRSRRCRRRGISCWATIATSRATAACGATCRAPTSTAKPCSCIGRWIKSAGYGNQAFVRS